MPFANAGVPYFRQIQPMITPAQCRAGRGLLNWTQAGLASRAHVSDSTIRHFESGRHVPTHNNHEAIQRALEEGGVVFLDDSDGCGPGVRLTRPE
jgi:predicted transcriptional regulator